MDANDKKTLLQRTSETQPSCLDVKGYDGKIAKEQYESTHWDDEKVHPKSCFGGDLK